MNDADPSAADVDVLPFCDDSCGGLDPWHDRDSRGRLSDEVPFMFELRLNRSEAIVFSQLGLSPVSAILAKAAGALIANCWYAALRGKGWIFYSRDAAFYANLKRTLPNLPAFYALSAMRAGVEILEAAVPWEPGFN